MKKFKDKAEREVLYFSKKKLSHSFQHDSEIEERLTVLERINADLNLRQQILHLAQLNKELCQAEEVTAKAFREKSGFADSFGVIFTTLEFVTTKLYDGRTFLFEELEAIGNEWNLFSVSVKNCYRLKELTDKHINDRTYYESKGEKENLDIADKRYQDTRRQFISDVTTLEEQTSTSYQNWSKRIAEAHYSFLKNTTDILGPILAMEYTNIKVKNHSQPVEKITKPRAISIFDSLPQTPSRNRTSTSDLTARKVTMSLISSKRSASSISPRVSSGSVTPKPAELPPKPNELPPKPPEQLPQPPNELPKQTPNELPSKPEQQSLTELPSTSEQPSTPQPSNELLPLKLNQLSNQSQGSKLMNELSSLQIGDVQVTSKDNENKVVTTDNVETTSTTHTVSSFGIDGNPF